MKRVVFTVLLIAALLLGLAGSVGASPPEENPGKGPPDLSKIVFIHYPKGAMAQGGIPGSLGGGDNDDKDWYQYRGIHWDGDEPIVYYKVEDVVDEDGEPLGFVDAIDAAFDEWEGTDASIDFENDGDFVGVPSSYVGRGSTNDVNEIAWISFEDSGLPSFAIGVTTVWYDAKTRLIVEVDMAMNEDLPWMQNDIETSDPDEVEGDLSFYDVQNIATHEAGHWLLLGDLYLKPAWEQTMCGYGKKGELRKRSLESGDIAGVLEIYPP